LMGSSPESISSGRPLTLAISARIFLMVSRPSCLTASVTSEEAPRARADGASRRRRRPRLRRVEGPSSRAPCPPAPRGVGGGGLVEVGQRGDGRFEATMARKATPFLPERPRPGAATAETVAQSEAPSATSSRGKRTRGPRSPGAEAGPEGRGRRPAIRRFDRECRPATGLPAEGREGRERQRVGPGPSFRELRGCRGHFFIKQQNASLGLERCLDLAGSFLHESLEGVALVKSGSAVYAAASKAASTRRPRGRETFRGGPRRGRRRLGRCRACGGDGRFRRPRRAAGPRPAARSIIGRVGDADRARTSVGRSATSRARPLKSGAMKSGEHGDHGSPSRATWPRSSGPGLRSVEVPTASALEKAASMIVHAWRCRRRRGEDPASTRVGDETTAPTRDVGVASRPGASNRGRSSSMAVRLSRRPACRAAGAEMV